MATAMTWEEALAHVGDLAPDAETMQRALMAIPHYLWMERGIPDSGFQGWPDFDDVPRKRKKAPLLGFCTNCMQWHALEECPVPDWVTDDPYAAEDYGEIAEFECVQPFRNMTPAKDGKPRHGRIGNCPGCGARAQYRFASKGYRSMRDRIFLIRYQRSAVEADAIVCLGYEVTMDWSEMEPCDGYHPPMDMAAAELCVMRYGKGGERFLRKGYSLWDDTVQAWTARRYEWRHMVECKSDNAPTARMVLDKVSLEEAVEGTRFAWLLSYPVRECDDWGYFDKISVLAKLAKYPCIEYLYKLGFERLAKYALDNAAGQLLYLRGKSAKAVLRLTDDQWGQVKGKKLDVTPGMLQAAQYAKREKLRWNMELCGWIGSQSDNALDQIKEIRKIHGALDLGEALKYCRRKNVRLYDYRDYLGQMKQLRMSLADKSLLYPGDFGEMHTRLSERIKAKANKGLTKKIAALLPQLAEYCFSAHGLVLRPMLSAKEVIREGTALHHCVGNYVNSYANGSTVLCCLREEAALDTPLYTVEFGKAGRLVQCRGERNGTRPEDEARLEAFWKLFELMRADLRTQAKQPRKRTRKESAA